MIRIILAGGSGFIGSHLIDHWRSSSQIQLGVIGRDKTKLQSKFGPDIQCWDWSDIRQNGKTILRTCQVLINLTGANIGDRLWTPARRRTILLSRVEPTLELAKLCQDLGTDAPRLLNASAVGVYGLQDATKEGLPEAFHETSPIDFTSAPDFLSRVGRSWELATADAKNNLVSVVNCRFAVVLDKKGGALPKMLLPYHFFMGGPVGSGHQPFSWVALPDVIRAIDFILSEPDLKGPVNIVAPECVTQKTFSKTVGKVMGRPAWLPLPGLPLKLLLGQMAKELLLSGTHVKPNLLLDKGFSFKHATLEDALTQILNK